jgi:hypothetical protein
MAVPTAPRRAQHDEEHRAHQEDVEGEQERMVDRQQHHADGGLHQDLSPSMSSSAADFCTVTVSKKRLTVGSVIAVEGVARAAAAR